MIPRRTAYRIWAACLGDEARRLRAMAADPANSPAKADGRRRRAAVLESAGRTVRSWIAGEGPRGGDLDPRMVALVAAYLYGHTPATVELRASGPGQGPPSDDPAFFLRWILDWPD